MPDIIFDIDENYNPMEDLRRAEGKYKKRLAELYREIGYLKPDPNRGVFTEIGHTVMDTNNQLGLSFGRTIEELTGNPNMRERYERKIELDPQYGADEFYSPSSLKPSHVARTVTTGAVQSLGAVGAGMLGTAIAGPAGGMAAAGGVTFGQIYGDTVKEYRDAMPGEDEGVVKGLAFTSAVGQSMLETIIGPEKMIAGFGKSFFSGALKETTKSLARRIGAEAAKGAVSEGAEEVLQDFWNRICKGVAAKEGFQPPSWEEVRDQFMGGALPGAVLGGVAGVRETRTGTDVNGVVRNGTENAGTKVPGGAAEGGAPIEGAPSTEAPIPVSEDAIIRGGGQTAAEALYDEIGIKHSRMTPEEQNTEGIGYVMQNGKKRIANGLFDRNTNEIKINPTNEGEMFTHGHELDHWLDKNHPDLARQLHVIMDSELNEAGLAENQSPIERRADMLGYLFEDPKTLKRTVEIGEANQAGFGEKFLNAVIEFSKQVMAFMKGHADLPGAEKYFNNYKKVRNTAAQILAELKSRNKAEQEKIKAETPELEMTPAANNRPDRPDRPNRQGADGNIAGGASRTVRTPDGSMEVPATFKVIPIEAAIHSGKAEYDQRFQPRNRDTKSSEAQIQKMSGEIHPEMLLDSPTTDIGAPIVDSKGQVISGNGRVMALLRARGQNIQDYYAAVRQFAAQNGIEIPADLKNPLLVREVGDTDLVKLAELSNRDNKLRRTDAEQAEADAKTIMDSNLLDIFNPNDDGTIITGQNMDFLREFIQRTGDDSLRDSDGRVASGAEQRVRRAILAAMFQGQKNARTLIQNLVENATTDGLKRQVDGVTAAVGRIMKLTAREGYQGYDLREDLAQAFEALLEYKRELQINSKRYNSINDYLKQGDMFERRLSPNAELLARFLGNARSIRQIRDVLNNYADHVERIDIHTDDMFGAKDEGKDSLLKRLLPGEETADTANSIGPIRPIGPIGETAETKAETRDQKDSGRPAVRSSSSEGRFNQDSETPLLSAEEDAGDFQLFSETPKEAAKRDQAAEKTEADKLERAREEARRNAPDLPFSGDEKSDPYAAIRAAREGSPERVKAFMELPDGEHELGGKKFSKQGNTFQREGQKLSARGIEKSFRGVDIAKKEVSDQSDVSDRSDNRGSQTETQDNPDTQGEVPKNYKEFDENGNWKITGEKNLGQLLDEFIAALKNRKCLKVTTPKGDFHLEEFNGKFCYIDPDGRIRIWEEKSVRSVLDRFIVSNNPKIRIVEESSTDAYKARKIQQDGSLLKPGDYAVFKYNGVFYEGDVASLGQKKVKLKTQSKMYGEQVISLPRESYLAHYAQSPFTLEGAALEKFNREYGSPEEYDNAKKSFMVQSTMRKEKPAREITSAAGKRADARTKRDVENFVGDGKQYSLQNVPSKEVFESELKNVLDTGADEKRYVFKTPADRQAILDGAKKFFDEFAHKEIYLSDGRKVYFYPDYRAFERGNAASAWAEYCIHAVTSSGKPIPGENFAERVFNHHKLENMDRIEPIIKEENVFAKFNDNDPARDAIIFIGLSNEGERMEIITRLDQYGNINADLTEVTVLIKSKSKGNPPHIPLTEAVESVARHQGAGYSPSTMRNLPPSPAKVNPDSEKNPEKSSDDQSGKVFSLRKRQQINPIVVNGQVRAEYADLLETFKYPVEKIPEWQDEAIRWIERQGGVLPAADQIANDTEHSKRHVATIARFLVLHSDQAVEIPQEQRTAIAKKNLGAGSDWGKEGAARRWAALVMKDMDHVRALFQKLHENMPDKEKVKLRNTILDQTGVDINNLPPDLVNNKSKLDEVLRAELANTSKWHDKAYEYWINAILSAPTTHSANIIGNTANALYELGPKRFAEAAVNALAKRKDAATFGEFREMWNALDFRSAWKKAKTAFDLETLTPGGKFRENATVAIPGKLGRAIRTPGRLLVMADAFARELLIPAETASRAYREAKNLGLTGDQLRSYIQQQMSNPGSTAYQAGKASAERIIFQEDPGAVLSRLIQLKASDGPGAQILKYLLPFVKTPGNILKQGIRKSPLGTLNLAWETVQAVRGKRAFDSEYLGHAAEQLIAWAAFLALGGFGDDDDDARPFLTGSSAPSGSGENKFKANTVPPYSIRIGDTYYSYRRIEPLATGLAAIADAHQAIREVRNGKDTAKALNDMLRKTGKMISEKSYLDSINQMVRFLEDPDRSLATFGTNFIASWVPNGLRAALNAGKDEVEDSKSRERGEEFLQDQLQVITSRMGFTSRAPKLDLFGHPITKEQQEDPDVTDFLLRLFVPVNRTAIDEDHPGKRLLLNYNASHPENQWWGSIPNYRFTHNKERYYFDNETYHQFAAEAGKLAEKQIFNAVRHGVIHPDNPTEKDIEVMKKIFARARKETRAKFFKKAKKW